ncbi:Hypp8515 [Branchiostoma lanceolatum]|uniref:Hypp8515 protein n=1 Tax=Branchiostoma lanceolatum TaxID=7740 RepID=A0A8K0EDP4_BRALA|nr:Hypp8515 [Branchiostoma lanceolatum]
MVTTAERTTPPKTTVTAAVTFTTASESFKTTGQASKDNTVIIAAVAASVAAAVIVAGIVGLILWKKRFLHYNIMVMANPRDTSVTRPGFQHSLTRKLKSSSGFDHLEIIIPVTVGGVAIILMIIAMCCVYWMKRRMAARAEESHTTPKPVNAPSTVYVIETSSENPGPHVTMQSAACYTNENCNTVDPDGIELLYVKPTKIKEISIDNVD